MWSSIFTDSPHCGHFIPTEEVAPVGFGVLVGSLSEIIFIESTPFVNTRLFIAFSVKHPKIQINLVRKFVKNQHSNQSDDELLRVIESTLESDITSDSPTQHPFQAESEPERELFKSPIPQISQIIDTPEIEAVDLEENWGESTEPDDSQPSISKKWLLITIVSIMGLAGWAVYQISTTQPKNERVPISDQSLQEIQEAETKEVRDLLDRMTSCVQGYLKAKTVDEMISYVRFPDRMKPLIHTYYKTHPRLNLDLESFEFTRPVQIGSTNMVYVQISLQQGGSYQLWLEQMPDGSFLVDWEYDVSYQPMPWDDFCKKRPLKPLDMRVQVKPDDYYGFAYRDRSRYQCYKLTYKNSDAYVFGYVEKGSAAATAMDAFFSKLTPPEASTEILDPSKSTTIKEIDPAPMILRIRFLKDDSSKRCVTIDAVIAKKWLSLHE